MITDFDPTTDILRVDVATDTIEQTSLATETHGDSLVDGSIILQLHG